MILTLPRELTLEHASEIRTRVLGALESREPVDALELDTAAVAEVDVAGLQLLCALHREAERRGTVVTFRPDRGDAITTAQLRAGFQRAAGCSDGCLCAEARRG